jgi:hypothetical protein
MGLLTSAPRMCHRKRGFWAESSAMEVANKMRRDFPHARVYRCPNCRRYHVTTKALA